MRSTRHRLQAAVLPGFALLLAFPARNIRAQQIVGSVVDSAGSPIEAAEVSVPDLGRHVLTKTDGTFRVEGLAPGTWAVSVRKIGFLPQSRRVLVGGSNGEVNFRLQRTLAVLPPLVTAASRLGLAGIVLDTAGEPVRTARVRVLSTGHSAETDSAGGFWIQVESGSYMVAISKPGFAQRLASVTIPPDSGRRIEVWLRSAVAVPVREAWNVEDMRERLSFIPPSRRVLYTTESLKKQHIETVFDAVNRLSSRFNLKVPISPNCLVVVDGGPRVTSLGSLTSDQVEAVEVYRRYSNNTATSQGARFVQRSNTDDATKGNVGLTCLGVYVWLR